MMKYIIMCGGPSCKWKVPKHLFVYKGRPILQRTIDLLKKNGISVKNIAITTSPDFVDKYSQFGVEVIPYEANKKPFFWLDAFYPTYEPACYLFGDVVYSSKAIKTIVKTKTDSIEFFASAPPFAPNYPKKWAEPFAFKVEDQNKFRRAIHTALENKNQHIWYRHPISWELWQVIKGTAPNHIKYDNYTVINDYTCDVDNAKELKQWEKQTT